MNRIFDVNWTEVTRLFKGSVSVHHEENQDELFQLYPEKRELDQLLFMEMKNYDQVKMWGNILNQIAHEFLRWYWKPSNAEGQDAAEGYCEMLLKNPS